MGSRRRQSSQDGTLRIAMIGTRGVPAAYGGFETAVEEIGKRLAERGHDVLVYCRRTGDSAPSEYLGMRLVQLPAARRKALETLSRTALSTLHALRHTPPDAAFVFNAANSIFLPLLQARRIPVAVHVDGLEWLRAKWGGLGQKFYRVSERLAVRRADALIADAQGIADYYTDEFEVGTELIAYGAPQIDEKTQQRLTQRLGELDLEAGKFHVVVARFEPENHVDVIVEGYRRSQAKWPLVVVGSAPYAAEYTQRIDAAAEGDERIRLLGGVWDQELLDALYAGAGTYVHGHSVGGTNPSLLRAIGAGTAVVAWDVVFNREVLGNDGLFFSDADDVARVLEGVEDVESDLAERGSRLQDMAAQRYTWERVTDEYERLARELANGASIRRQASGRRTGRWRGVRGASAQDEAVSDAR